MRTLLGTACVLATLALSACGTDPADQPAAADKTPTGSSSPSSSGSTSGDEGLTDEELAAAGAIVAGADPKNLTWSLTDKDVPKEWRRVTAEPGALQWQVGTAKCVITLTQPAGLGTSARPDSAQVARDYAQRVADATGGLGELDEPTPVPLDMDVNNGTAQSRATAMRAHFTGSTKGVEGASYGYRAGDFALTAVAICGSGQYADQGAALEKFIEDLTVGATY